MFPCAEFAEDAVERHLRIVRRKRNESASRAPAIVAVILSPDLPAKSEPMKSSNDLMRERKTMSGLVVFPCHHNVVGTHAVRNVVASECGRSREALRDAALGWHDVNFSVAVVLRSKSDLSSIRRKP